MLTGFNLLFGIVMVAVFIFVGLLLIVQQASGKLENTLYLKACALLGILALMLGLFMGVLLFVVYALGVTL